MSPTLLQYLIESTFCLAVFWGLYRVLVKRWLSVLSQRYYLLVTPLLALLIPIWDVSNLGGADEVVSGYVLDHWFSSFPLIKITPLALLSIVYFSGVCWQAFSLVDRFQSTWGLLRAGYGATAWKGFRYRDFPFLAALFHYHFEDANMALTPGPRLQLWFRQIRIWHVAEVVLLELGLVLFWFQPFLYFFRSELHHQNRVLLEHAAGGRTVPVPSWSRWAISVLGTGSFLFLLFSVNQFCRLPFGSELESWSLHLQTRWEEPLFSIGTPVQQTASFTWGIQHVVLFPEQLDKSYRYRPTQLTNFEFSLARTKSWNFQYAGKQTEAKDFQGILSTKDGKQQVFSSEKELEAYLLLYDDLVEFTLYLQVEDPDGKTWLGVLGVTDTGDAYGMKSLGDLSDQVEVVQWQRFKETPWFIDIRPQALYHLEWGSIRQPLKQYANPDLFNGFVELTAEGAKELADNPIRFYYRDSLLSIESLDFYSQGKRWDQRTIFKMEVEDTLATLISKDDFLKEVEPGKAFLISARLPGVVLSQFYIRIIDPKGAYEPMVSLPQPRLPDTTFSFQLIDRKELASVVKLDTLHGPTRQVYDLYKTYPRYKIHHIPGFKTYRRLVSYDEGGLSLIGNSELLPRSFFAGDALPEFLDYPGRKIQLRWGELFAAPDSEVYGLDEWQKAIQAAPFIQVDQQQFELVHAVVFIISDLESESVVVLNEQTLASWSPATEFEEMPSHRTLFFQELIIKTESGERMVFPEPFAMHIGKPASHFSWEITSEEVEFPDEASLKQDSNSIQYLNYPLTQLLTDLNNRKLNRVEFDGLQKDIFLNISLVSEDTLPENANEILLQHLKKEYRLVFDQGRMDIPNRRLQVLKPNLLDAALYDSEEPPLEKIRILRESTHLLTGVTLEELATHLEDHFGIPFDWYPHNYHDNQYIFTVDVTSLEILARQLEMDYGISVSEADWIWNGLRVLFMD